MNLTIVGTGYVGLVTGTCFAEMGNNVTCIDIDEAKLAQLREGIVPIHEPGLEALVHDNLKAGRLNFSNDLGNAINNCKVTFIAVGTPPKEDGSADLSYVEAVARSIGETMVNPLVVVNKSTVPVGTGDKVHATIDAALKARGLDIEFDVISNPEFLREGDAIKDFMFPDRIVVGANNEKSQRVMDELYDAFAKKEDRIQYVGIRDAEMIKYAANAMLATKISFMNEVSVMCDELGIDVENVRRGVGSDARIGPSFMYPGCGYGGSCFPKDVKAMITMAQGAGIDGAILQAVESRNERQKRVIVDKVIKLLSDDLKGKCLAIWGLAFKPETDDMREASSLVIIDELRNRGATIHAYDPEAIDAAWAVLGDNGITYFEDPYTAVEGADALIIVTEWREFRQPDFRRLSKSLKSKLIFDGRNIYNPARVANHGLIYEGIGRSSALLESG
ncbi:MAG: UDP-glucose 6-dehydrogenase [Gammaproteobacteria bacterium]|nr:UDP-glucose 6-dehydrogenase [Gammaproteobacteria bacterium]